MKKSVWLFPEWFKNADKTAPYLSAGWSSVSEPRLLHHTDAAVAADDEDEDDDGGDDDAGCCGRQAAGRARLPVKLPLALNCSETAQWSGAGAAFWDSPKCDGKVVNFFYFFQINTLII